MNRLKFDKCRFIAMVLFMLVMVGGWTGAPVGSAAESTIDTIIAGVESRYNVAGFTADFEQESILTAMGVTDTASGRLLVRQPGKMRWEYLVPDPQTIITDGKELWVYRPEENQVLVGKAPALFGEGRGAGFLSNIKMVRQSFQLTLEPNEDTAHHHLRLVPHQPSPDLVAVDLIIDVKTYQLLRITTFNVYGDETRIELKNVNFSDPPPDALFHFDLPEGVELLQMSP
jgi:outer membrane lipoprotein carrier protein